MFHPNVFAQYKISDTPNIFVKINVNVQMKNKKKYIKNKKKWLVPDK